jgi:putative tryptophan/tyrosine transport system permease protein
MRLTLQRTRASAPWRQWIVILLLVGFAVLLIAPSLRQMSFNVWLGAIAAGLGFGFVAMGVYISFRVLDFPDLTIDGSFPLGAAISATMITAGFNPFLTLPIAIVGGASAGVATAVIATRLKIHSLLASILVTTGLISINLRIMGRSNIPLLNEPTIFTRFAGPFRDMMRAIGGDTLARMSNNILAILLFLVVTIAVKLLLDYFMHTEVGLTMRATGDNPQMVRALGGDTNGMIVLGLAISNGLVGLSGALIAQYQGFADVNMGIGLIIAGLAAVILGETLFRPITERAATRAVVLGMVIYRIAIAAALTISIPLPWGGNFSVDAQDVKLATAALVLVALWFTHMQKRRS